MMDDRPNAEIDLNGAIWRFALDFYGRPGVSDACLRLQDEAGVDVVAMILVLYADAKLNRRLGGEEIAALRAGMNDWREQTVLPLRSLRRRLKVAAPGFPRGETEALRGMVKKAELRAEQIQLAMGESWLNRHPAQAGVPVGKALALLVEDAPGRRADDLAQLFGQVIDAARAAGAP